MIIILVNEVLHTVGNSTFYKTYDTVRDLYGIHSNAAGTFLEPSFLHIFSYKEGRFVVVDQLEQYYAIDLKGKRLELTGKEEAEWKMIIIKSSTCNCMRTRSTHTCTYCCGDGTINNTFGMKLLSKFF
ncbi:hypothetical protein [Pontibacter sp. BAB1700]|uniref:hypothetical protein n=1 Tax=Pontibacter sp. BAB1700 TaxID=1144253 RepID=UPI00026BC98B|nr:hypothetical protein [Pontibacter sp. BAB1700]EJF10599.1 hypothetical protein O71_08168 [Pontibacter sp. BAB1700]